MEVFMAHNDAFWWFKPTCELITTKDGDTYTTSIRFFDGSGTIELGTSQGWMKAAQHHELCQYIFRINKPIKA